MTGDRTSRRGILAAIALTDNLPMPKEVTFYEHRDGLNLSFDTVEQGAAWCRFLGYENQPYIHEGRRYVGQYGVITWHGWQVGINASEPAPDVDEPLPADQRDALHGMVDGPDGAA
jgi:hypothetical protein